MDFDGGGERRTAAAADGRSSGSEGGGGSSPALDDLRGPRQSVPAVTVGAMQWGGGGTLAFSPAAQPSFGAPPPPLPTMSSSSGVRLPRLARPWLFGFCPSSEAVVAAGASHREEHVVRRVSVPAESSSSLYEGQHHPATRPRRYTQEQQQPPQRRRSHHSTDTSPLHDLTSSSAVSLSTWDHRSLSDAPFAPASSSLSSSPFLRHHHQHHHRHQLGTAYHRLSSSYGASAASAALGSASWSAQPPPLTGSGPTAIGAGGLGAPLLPPPSMRPLDASRLLHHDLEAERQRLLSVGTAGKPSTSSSSFTGASHDCATHDQLTYTGYQHSEGTYITTNQLKRVQSDSTELN